MERIVLVGFPPCDNGCNCELHPFGCDNSLVLNRDDYGVGLRLSLRMTAPHELACCTIKTDGRDGCRACFTAQEYAAGENCQHLDGALVQLTDVFIPEDANRSMRCLYHHVHCCVVESHSNGLRWFGIAEMIAMLGKWKFCKWFKLKKKKVASDRLLTSAFGYSLESHADASRRQNETRLLAQQTRYSCAQDGSFTQYHWSCGRQGPLLASGHQPFWWPF